MAGQTFFPELFIAVVILAVVLSLLRRSAKRYSIPRGKEVYDDLGSRGRVLKSQKYGLTGKPDMIVRKGRKLIPYEYKSTDASVPREGHIFQMVAYFLILEDLYPKFTISYGVLKYKNQAFRIDNLDENKRKLLDVVSEMRNSRFEPLRNHSNSGRCFRCSFKENCQQNLIRQHT